MERQDKFVLHLGCLLFGFGFAVAQHEFLAMITAFLCLLFVEEKDIKRMYRLRYGIIIAVLLSAFILYLTVDLKMVLGFGCMMFANIISTVCYSSEDLDDYRFIMQIYIGAFIFFIGYTLFMVDVPFGIITTLIICNLIFLPLSAVYGLQLLLHKTVNFKNYKIKNHILHD